MRRSDGWIMSAPIAGSHGSECFLHLGPCGMILAYMKCLKRWTSFPWNEFGWIRWRNTWSLNSIIRWSSILSPDSCIKTSNSEIDGREHYLDFGESIYSVSDGQPRDLALRSFCNAEFDSHSLIQKTVKQKLSGHRRKMAHEFLSHLYAPELSKELSLGCLSWISSRQSSKKIKKKISVN